MQTNSFFNFDDFKKWIKDKPEEDSQKFKRKSFNGIFVESKIGVRKLISKMEPNEGDAYEVAQEFLEKGGIIKESQDKHFLIETDLGDFYIHRSYVRRS
jgi:hypothetical protein